MSQIPLFQHPLPQLIQETLYFYECQIRIKRLHEEYKGMVSESDDGRVLRFYTKNAIILRDPYYRRQHIWNFIPTGYFDVRYVCRVSKFHNYTSGMTNRRGYKNNVVDLPMIDLFNPTNFVKVNYHPSTRVLRRYQRNRTYIHSTLELLFSLSS